MQQVEQEEDEKPKALLAALLVDLPKGNQLSSATMSSSLKRA
jgi:hypothetical protein